MKIDRLVHACQEDTAVLTSLLGWLDEEREKVLERLADVNKTDTEIRILQGEARKLKELRTTFPAKLKLRAA